MPKKRKKKCNPVPGFTKAKVEIIRRPADVGPGSWDSGCPDIGEGEEKSKGHKMFLGKFEYFQGPDGDLYRAPLDNYIGTNGYRVGGRFECKQSQINRHVKHLKKTVRENLEEAVPPWAKTVLQQIGGNKALYMMGSKQVSYSEKNKTVNIRIGRNKTSANYLVIHYDRGKDLYDVELVRATRKGSRTTKAEAEGLYADQLKPWIEKETGLYLSLGTMGRSETKETEAQPMRLTESEVRVANRMVVKGYNYILIAEGVEPVYGKTREMLEEINENRFDDEGKIWGLRQLVEVDEGRGDGMGQGGPYQGDGGAEMCVCPACGHEMRHERGTPCNETECPECGAMMIGEALDEARKLSIGDARPAIRDLAKAFKVDTDTAKEVKNILKSGRGEDALKQINDLVDGFGVEYLQPDEDRGDDFTAEYPAYYINMGDTYKPTLLYDGETGKIYLTTWGSWYEYYADQEARRPHKQFKYMIENTFVDETRRAGFQYKTDSDYDSYTWVFTRKEPKANNEEFTIELRAIYDDKKLRVTVMDEEEEEWADEEIHVKNVKKAPQLIVDLYKEAVKEFVQEMNESLYEADIDREAVKQAAMDAAEDIFDEPDEDIIDSMITNAINKGAKDTEDAIQIVINMMRSKEEAVYEAEKKQFTAHMDSVTSNPIMKHYKPDGDFGTTPNTRAMFYELRDNYDLKGQDQEVFKGLNKLLTFAYKVKMRPKDFAWVSSELIKGRIDKNKKWATQASKRIMKKYEGMAETVDEAKKPKITVYDSGRYEDQYIVVIGKTVFDIGYGVDMYAGEIGPASWDLQINPKWKKVPMNRLPQKIQQRIRKRLRQYMTGESVDEAQKVVVYDAGEDAFDRYTVIIGTEAYGMSNRPFSPQGFNQFVGDVGKHVHLGKHLGKKVSVKRLPKEVQKAIRQRQTDEARSQHTNGDEIINEVFGNPKDMDADEIQLQVVNIEPIYLEAVRLYKRFGGGRRLERAYVDLLTQEFKGAPKREIEAAAEEMADDAEDMFAESVEEEVDEIRITIPKADIAKFTNYADERGVSSEADVTFTESGDMVVTLTEEDAALIGVGLSESEDDDDADGLVEIEFDRSKAQEVMQRAEFLRLPDDTPVRYSGGKLILSVPQDIAEQF
jgi:hypothetical protein